MDIINNDVEMKNVMDLNINTKIYSFELPRTTVYGHENFTRITDSLRYLKTKFNQFMFHITNTYDENENLNYLTKYYKQTYLDKIKNFTFTDVKPYNWFDDDWDTYFDKYTYQEMMLTFNLVLQSIEDVKHHELKMAYLLVRPPSHHSAPNYHSGYCVINNTYILADLCTRNFGKTLIFDYDLHHCDGTENMLKYMNNNLIELISTHYYQGKKFFPGSGKACKTSNITNINLRKNSTTEHCLRVLQTTLDEIKTKDFKCVVVSNGLDAHVEDSFDILHLTDDFYVEMARFFKNLNIPVFYVLEGGYNNYVISRVSEKIVDVFC